MPAVRGSAQTEQHKVDAQPVQLSGIPTGMRADLPLDHAGRKQDIMKMFVASTYGRCSPKLGQIPASPQHPAYAHRPNRPSAAQFSARNGDNA